MYLQYAEYMIMGGNLDEADFNRLSFMAESYINKQTFNRLKKLSNDKIPQEVKMCVYELVNKINETNKSSGVASESQSVGNVSESRTYIQGNMQTHSRDLIHIISIYLDGVRVDGREVLNLAI